jgi:subtilisin family serine protease
MNVTRCRRPIYLAALLMGSVSLAACGGGGGGSPGGGITTPAPPSTPTTTPTPPPPVTTPPVVVAPIVTPSTTSSEYRRNAGLALIKPEAGWTQGATGAGITVAVIDTGVSTNQTDLAGRVTTFDVVAGRTGEPVGQHGTSVAGVIASAFNNTFTVGVAYEADILGIRADQTGSCDTECKFGSHDLAVAIDYARTHGARVINLSLGSEDGSGSEVRAAMKRAVDAGIVLVASAGNDANENPGFPAAYAVDSRYIGALIAAGALNSSGTALAGFSDRAGTAQDGYLAAPGQNILTNCQATSIGSSCASVSGTSFAAPHIAGALALLLDGFPNISGRDAVDILFRSARDMGEAGTDAVFGRGALDIERAFQPLGALSSPTAAGGTFVVDGTGSAASSGAAFGDVFAGAPAALQTVAYDDYERLYQVNLGSAWRSSARPNPLPAPAPAGTTTSVVQPLDGGGALRVLAFTGTPERVAPAGSHLTAGRGPEATSVSLARGALRLDLWSGRGGMQPAFDGAPADAFTTLAQAGEAMRAGVAVGRWTFSAESGAGLVDPLSRLDLLADPAASREPSRYNRAVAAFTGEDWRVSVGAGALREPAGPLGSMAPASSSLSMPAESRFTSVSGLWRGVPGVQLTADAAFGRTDAGGPLMTLAGAATSSWSFAADVSCARLGLAVCNGVTLSVSQPLRIEAGEVTTTLADVPLDYSDPITFSRRTLSLAPSGREIDLGLGVHRPFGPGTLRLQASALLSPGHRADADVAYGLSAAFRARF